MIELSFWDFHEGKYDDEGYSLYIMKNGFDGILYIGISQLDIWSR
jgi:hypothetical protein